MNDASPSAFTTAPDRLPLLTDHGSAFLGLQHSSSPELVERVRQFFAHLNRTLGFLPTPEGKEAQDCFNLLLRAAYPELMLDLADLIYVQHERPAVFLNFDHININLRRERSIDFDLLPELNGKMEALFLQLTKTLKKNVRFCEDPEIIRLLSESYSYYIFQTGNFPWDEALPTLPLKLKRPLMDIATGLTGFNIIHLWPEDHPTLFLTDNMPFIVEGLTHFKNLAKKRNIEILKVDFGAEGPEVPALGGIWVNKFLHHLKRHERQQFLRWAVKGLAPGGNLQILDTDLEHRILQKGKNKDFKGKLIPGYLETLVSIEGDFCETLVSDTKQAGFKVTHFDFNKYHDETDAYSQFPGDDISIDFLGFEIAAEK
ncbi:MAG: hypothetical protein NPINA01_01140 [Nitrospinaceae bacterium]|nr:MAG: hypothetical protein NPINA01_01140 [Nitrospinaceae bacterium]